MYIIIRKNENAAGAFPSIPIGIVGMHHMPAHGYDTTRKLPGFYQTVTMMSSICWNFFVINVTRIPHLSDRDSQQ